jgi:ATP-dependent helicase HepA
MKRFLPGQRWMSESEPEQGLGIVTEVDAKTLSILFPATQTNRKYGLNSAPLKRVVFAAGDEIQLQDGQKIIVIDVREDSGRYFYKAGETPSEYSEVLLAATLSFSKPQDRFFNGQIDSPKAFDLRIDTLRKKMELAQTDALGKMGPRISLIPHQQYVAHVVAKREHPRVLLADEVGLGKTIEAGLIIHQLLTSGRIERVLIVVPNTLVYQWFVEMLRRFNLSFAAVNEDAKFEKGYNPFENNLVILSLRMLVGSPKVQELVKKEHWDMLVVDEAHKLNWTQENAGEDYLLIEALSKKISSLLLLTATPEQLGQQGHFARLRLIDPNRFFDFDTFLEESGHYKKVAKLVDKIVHGEENLTKMEIEFLRDVMPPNKKNHYDFETLDAKQKQELLQDLVDAHGVGRVFFRNTRQTIGKEFNFFPVRKRFVYPIEKSKKGDEAKFFWLLDFLIGVKGEKVLLICHSKKKILELEELFKLNSNIVTGVFHSDLTLLARDRQAAYFADPSGAQILLCTEIGSEGRNFEFAHHLVLYDIPEIPDLLEQRIGRLDRIGQKSVIQIHVPYINQSKEEFLCRWYEESFDAFSHAATGVGQIYEQYKVELMDLLDEEKHKKFEGKRYDDFISDTKASFIKLKKQLEEGRDRLIELNSFHQKNAHDIIENINAFEDKNSVKDFMFSIFNNLGVDIDDLNATSYYVKPSDNMFIPSFPGLTDEGLSITFERSVALAREDLEFISWDHPMVSNVMNIVATEPMGSVTVKQYKGDGGTPLIEAYYVLECQAPTKLHVNRFAPPSILRVCLDLAGKDQTKKYPKKEIDDKTQVPSGERFEEIKLFPKDRLLSLIAESKKFALARAQVLKAQYVEKTKKDFEHEILRLEHLKIVNKSISSDELNSLADRKNAIIKAIEEATIKFDSFRIIV